MSKNVVLRHCPKECQPEACICRPKAVAPIYDQNKNPTPCEEKENNGIAGFYYDDDVDDFDKENIRKYEFYYITFIRYVFTTSSN